MQNFENRLRFDKVTGSLKVRTFFETQSSNMATSSVVFVMLQKIQILSTTQSTLMAKVAANVRVVV